MPKFVQGGIVDQNYIDLLQADIDVVFMRKTKKPYTLSRFFDKIPIDAGLDFTISSVGDALQLPQENADGENLPYYTPAAGDKKTLNLLQYRSGIRATRIQLKADRQNKTRSMLMGQTDSGNVLDEWFRATIFNNHVTGTDGADSQPLCADSHPHENVEAGTWDNLGSGALTGANLQASILLQEKIRNEQNDPMVLTSAGVLAPVDLKQKLKELIGSNLTAETGLNTATVIIDALEGVYSKYLSSTTAWWVFANVDKWQKGLHEVVLEDWNIINNSPSDGGIVIDKQIRAAKTFDFTKSKAFVGSTGS